MSQPISHLRDPYDEEKTADDDSRPSLTRSGGSVNDSSPRSIEPCDVAAPIASNGDDVDGPLGKKGETKKDAPDDDETGEKPSIWNLLVLSVSIMMLFLAFNSSQTKMGHIVLAVLYMTFSIGNFFAPVIIHLLRSLKLTIILGAFPYVLLIIATGLPTNVHYANVLLILGGFFVGCSAPLLWSAHGGILTRSAAGTKMSLFSGIFWSVFQTSLIWGFLLTGLLKNVLKLRHVFIFSILAWIGTLGVIGLLFLRVPEEEKKKKPKNEIKREKKEAKVKQAVEEKHDDQKPQEGKKKEAEKEEEDEGEKFSCSAFIRSLFASLVILFDLRFLLLSPMFLQNGYSYAFYFGTLTHRAGKIHLLAWAFAGFAGAEFLGSLSYGRLCEYFGNRPMMWVQFFFAIVSLAYTFTLDLHVVFLFVTVAFCGISDSGYNTLIYSMVGKYYARRPAAAFATFKFVQSVAISVQFWTEKVFTFFETQMILAGILVVAMISFFILDAFVSPVDKFVDEEGRKKDCGDINLLRACWSCLRKKMPRRCVDYVEQGGGSEEKEQQVQQE